MQASALTAASPAAAIRVMVVDDSAVIRGILTRWLEEDPAIQVVTTASNGLMALRQMPSYSPDVVVLDIEMPEMDGLTALPKLLEAKPGLKVIMASTLTERNADISLHALSLGAVDYIPKPQSTRIVNAGIDFRRELVDKVKAVTGYAKRHAPPAPAAPAAAPRFRAAGPAPAHSAAAPAAKAVQARISPDRPQILAIGSSTGGPQALFTLLSGLAKPFPLPVLITQHMPPTFTAILAQHISRQTGHQAAEAVHGEALRPGRIYIAPGDKHMVLTGTAAEPKLALNQDPPVNFCRPAVDPMFASISALFGARTLSVVLTGMGHDGRDGARVINGSGGSVIAQDEASSVVWGMPGSVVQAGLAGLVLPLNDIAKTITKLVEGARP